MAKRSTNKNRALNNKPANVSQRTKGERINDLKQEMKNKEEAQLLNDEKVVAKLQELEQQLLDNKVELENKKAELEKEYSENEKKLQTMIEERQFELEVKAELLATQINKCDEKEKELAYSEKLIQEQCETAITLEIRRIKDNERAIREEEKEIIYAEFEDIKTQKKKDLDDYIKEQREKVDVELELAHTERIKAEDLKYKKLQHTNAEIEEIRAKLTREYEEKAREIANRKLEYELKLQDLVDQQADLDADREYIKELKEKYNKYSEREVLLLQHKLEHYEAQVEVYTSQLKELSDKTAQMQSKILDDDGSSLLIRINELEEQLADAIKRNDRLANMPSEDEIERLRMNTYELENLRITLDDEKQKRHEAETKISAYALSARELENARVTAAALESLNNQLQMKLKYISEQYKTTQESKFKVLLDIDKEIEEQGIFNPKGFNRMLPELCEYVRDYGASKEGLYYSIETIRVFFASLAASERASRLLIMQGLSGTGKSSLPRLVAEALDAECKLVPVQPSWRDNRELLGYDNDFTNRFKETEFTKFLYEASALPNRKKIYLIVLDEMNLARIEYYFADFLSVLEKPDQCEWIIPLVSGYSELDEDQKPKYLDYSNEAANICVTNNIWFVGTANNDDSTSLITDKVYDRAQVLDMDKREEKFNGKRIPKASIDLDELLGLFEEAKVTKNKLTNDDKEKIALIDEYLNEMDITFGNRIMNQMDSFVPVYIACGGTKEEAIDYLLTHKILRKLDERYEPYLVTKLEELEMGLNEIYGDGKFKESIEKIQRLREKIAG